MELSSFPDAPLALSKTSLSEAMPAMMDISVPLAEPAVPENIRGASPQIQQQLPSPTKMDVSLPAQQCLAILQRALRLLKRLPGFFNASGTVESNSLGFRDFDSAGQAAEKCLLALNGLLLLAHTDGDILSVDETSVPSPETISQFGHENFSDSNQTSRSNSPTAYLFMSHESLASSKNGLLNKLLVDISDTNTSESSRNVEGWMAFDEGCLSLTDLHCGQCKTPIFNRHYLNADTVICGSCVLSLDSIALNGISVATRFDGLSVLDLARRLYSYLSDLILPALRSLYQAPPLENQTNDQLRVGQKCTIDMLFKGNIADFIVHLPTYSPKPPNLSAQLLLRKRHHVSEQCTYCDMEKPASMIITCEKAEHSLWFPKIEPSICFDCLVKIAPDEKKPSVLSRRWWHCLSCRYKCSCDICHGIMSQKSRRGRPSKTNSRPSSSSGTGENETVSNTNGNPAKIRKTMKSPVSDHPVSGETALEEASALATATVAINPAQTKVIKSLREEIDKMKRSHKAEVQRLKNEIEDLRRKQSSNSQICTQGSTLAHNLKKIAKALATQAIQFEATLEHQHGLIESNSNMNE